MKSIMNMFDCSLLAKVKIGDTPQLGLFMLLDIELMQNEGLMELMMGDLSTLL